MTKFYLVRHGATRMNKQSGVSVDRERGWSDVPLTAEGRAEAQKAGLKLRGKGIEHVSASNLARAAETARTIGHHIGVKPHLEHDLRPWNLGDLTGQEMSRAKPQMENYARNRPDEPVPGGESFNQFKSRGLRAVAKHIRGASNDRSLLVSHHRIERLLSSLKPNGDTDFNKFFEDGEPPGSIQEFDFDPKQLERFGARVKRPSHGSSELPSQDDADAVAAQRGATPGEIPPHHHALALGGAHHLAKAGYITPEEHKRIQKRVRSALLMRASLRET